MTKKKWIILGSVVAGVVVVATVLIAVLGGKIFDGGRENVETKRISVTRLSLGGEDVNTLGEVQTTQVSSEYQVGTSPTFTIVPSSIGCIYSVKVNGEEVYDYLNNSKLDITKPFTYTFNNLQKESNIVITFDRRGNISELKTNKTDTTNLVTTDGSEVYVHTFETESGENLKDICLGTGFNSYGDISLYNEGGVFPMHGAVKIKINAVDERFELFGYNYLGEAQSMSTMHKVVDGEFSYDVDGYENLCKFNPEDNTLIISNYSKFISLNGKLVLYYIPVEVSVETYERIDGAYESLSTTKYRLFDRIDRIVGVSLGYSTTNNFEIPETENFLYMKESGGEYVSASASDYQYIFITDNLYVNGDKATRVIKLIKINEGE